MIPLLHRDGMSGADVDRVFEHVQRHPVHVRNGTPQP